MNLYAIDDVKKQLNNKLVFVRVDFNVPLKWSDSNAVITDDSRITKALPTIEFLIKNNAKIILASHLGRPQGKLNSKLSLKPIYKYLIKKISTKIYFVDQIIEKKVDSLKNLLNPGEILLLENLRFNPGEKNNDPIFAKKLFVNIDFYVNEAFSVCHRSHASIIGVPKKIPQVAGLALQNEVKMLNQLLEKPIRPFVIVIGGAKISDKVTAIENLEDLADSILVGGGVANNFLKAEGFEIAKSYLQDTPADLKKKGIDYIEIAEDLIEETKQEKTLISNYIPVDKILYPIDVLTAPNPNSKSATTITLTNKNRPNIQKNHMFLDIGPKTIKLYQKIISQAKTIFWNGPMGVFENPIFENGTEKIANAIAKSNATTILGGGDTIRAINKFKLQDKYNFVSAAGGAALEFLSGKKLPGLKKLTKS